MNKSPRISQIYRNHKKDILGKSESTDVCIVGAGIAGIMTAYYTLLNTQKNVVIVEADKVAHGATGHNAGQIAPYFEKPYNEIVAEYGDVLAHEAQEAIWGARDALQEIMDYTNIDLPIEFFTGYAVCTTKQQVESHLYKKQLREKTHTSIDAIFVKEGCEYISERSNTYGDLFSTIPAEKIKEYAQTKSDEFIALLVCKKGVTNSAYLCEKLLIWMQKTYGSRLRIFEDSPVSNIYLGANQNVITIVNQYKQPCSTIQADDIVLCTNGFEHFSITHHTNCSVNLSYHDAVTGLIGYMSAYADSIKKDSTAISYFTSQKISGENNGTGESYFYLTRRPFVLGGEEKTLIAVGGPELPMPVAQEYKRDEHNPLRAYEKNKTFLRTYYVGASENQECQYNWHGLMGFTKTGLRYIGKHPQHSTLRLNVGCNGVGILTSIHGGWKIGKMLSGEEFGPSVFDVVL